MGQGLTISSAVSLSFQQPKIYLRELRESSKNRIIRLITQRYSNNIFRMSSFTVEWINDIKDLFQLPSTSEKSPANIAHRGDRQRIVLNQTRPSESSDRKRAAVLVPICNRNGIASVIFTLRTDTVSTHKASITCLYEYH